MAFDDDDEEKKDGGLDEEEKKEGEMGGFKPHFGATREAAKSIRPSRGKEEESSELVDDGGFTRQRSSSEEARPSLSIKSKGR